ncbi:MAG: Lrp/AsnC family transcriptional regulator [Candidatus Micrarchaeota archaeon]|nr:Lrp/AsnC family transcriptional regulator [Candidatus Micrarchaeota archaeon]
MDLTDRKILYELDQDSRQSYSSIAKTLKTSPQVVKYRVENLQKSGVLQYCWPMIEYRKADYFFGLYFFKLQNMDKESEKELFDYLNSHRFIPIIMRGEGYADLIIAICAKGIFHLRDIITELSNRFGKNFREYDTTIPIGFTQFHRAYLIDAEKKQPREAYTAFTGAEVREEMLSESERKVLSMVNYNARVPLVQIARKIGISEISAKNIVKKLEKVGIIQSYTILPDHVLLGKPRHRVLFKLANLTSQKEKMLFTYCQLHPNIVHHLRVIGNWDLVLDIEVERGEPFRKIIQEMKYKFSDIISRVEPTYIYKIDQFRDIPIEYPKLNSK